MIGKKKPAQPSLPPIELEATDLMSIPAPPRAKGTLDVDISFESVPPAKPRRNDATTSWENLELFNSSPKVLAPPPVAGLFVEQKPNPLALPSLAGRVRSLAGQQRLWLGIATLTIIGAASWYALPLARGTTEAKSTTAARAQVAAPSAPARTAEPTRAQPKTAAAPAMAAAAPAELAQAAPTPAADPPEATSTNVRPVKTAAAGKPKAVRADTNADAPPPPRAEAPELSQIPVKAAPPVQAAAPLPDVDVAGEFDRNAAMQALRDAGDASRSCLTAGAGGARVAVTFARSGSVSDVSVDPPLAGTPAGNCVAGKFRSLRVPPFRGSAVTVRKTISS